MTVVTEVVAKLRADTSDFTSGFKTAERSVGSLGQSVDKLDDKVDRLSTVNTKAKGSMGGLGKGAGIAGIALGGAAIGAGLLVAGFAKLASEAQASLAVQRTTEQIIKSTGGAAKVTSEQVSALSTELSKKTGVDDESIQAASNLLLTFKNVKNAGEGQAAMFDRATSSALDLSKAGFGSVDSAAKMLGKALNDPTKGITALSRAGVTFSEEQKASIKAMAESGDMLGAQVAIMAEVESQVGGVAEATRNPMEALQTMFGNLKEEIGMALLPTINKLVDVIGPLLQQLGPPLAEVAGIVAGALSTAIEALAPMLPPLAKVFGEIAGVLGGALNSVISALIPVVMPLVQILGELAAQIAPVLSSILGTVAEVIGRVLQAVLPLIPPLADLVMTIFKQAGPIIDLVADALLTIVDALTPVIAAVSQLLPFITQLVNVVFAAIMPILKPLLPIIQVLADLLGTILVKAVSVLMMGLGYLIQGWAKLAPFILENVTKPVVEFFLSMVKSVLEGAQTMLGWIPGLGEKLDQAVAAFDGLSKGVSDGIQSAAETVSREGKKIGQGMVDQGLAMFNDPNAPKAAGSQFGFNLASGVEQQGENAYAAGLSLSNKTAAGMKAAQQAAWAAGMSMAGAFQAGVDGDPAPGGGLTAPDAAPKPDKGGAGGGDKKSAAEIAADREARRVQALRAGVAAVEAYGKSVAAAIVSRDAGLREAGRQVAAAMDAVDAAKENIKAAKTVSERAQAEMDRAEALRVLAAATDDLAKAERNVGKASIEATRSAADAGSKALANMKQKASDALALFNQTKAAMMGYASITTLEAPPGASPSAGAYLANMKSRLANIRKFGTAIESLRKMGLNNTVLQDIISAGPEAGLQMAQAIVAAGKGMVGNINTTQGQINAASTNAANQASLGGAQGGFGMTGAEARGVTNTNVTVEKGAVVIQFGEGTSQADATRIQSIVDTAVGRAFNKAAQAAGRR